jgi:hypothetical protein
LPELHNLKLSLVLAFCARIVLVFSRLAVALTVDLVYEGTVAAEAGWQARRRLSVGLPDDLLAERQVQSVARK